MIIQDAVQSEVNVSAACLSLQAQWETMTFYSLLKCLSNVLNYKGQNH